MKGNYLILGGLLAGLIFWVLPSLFVQGKNPFLPFALAIAFGFATGILATKKYDSLLANGTIDSPLMRLVAQLLVLGMQFLVAFILTPIVSQI